MAVTVTPEHFTMVDFDHGELLALANRLAADAGLPADLDVHLDVLEDMPTNRMSVSSLEPLQITVEGGAIENPKRRRELGQARVIDVLGKLFMQARDQLDPSFGGPALDDKISLQHRVSWDAYALGRLERLGYDAQRTRRQYHFRNRHGFTDTADAAFDRLWAAQGLTWSQIVSISDEAQVAVPAP